MEAIKPKFPLDIPAGSSNPREPKALSLETREVRCELSLYLLHGSAAVSASGNGKY